jgi:hypothetical protein
MPLRKATPDGQTHRSLVQTFLWLLIGPLLWSLHFSVVYGAHAMLCARGFSGPTTALLVVAATIAALLALAWVFPRNSTDVGSTERFERRVMTLLIVLSMVGVAWSGAATIFVRGCLPLR